MIGATLVAPTIPVSDLERSKAFYGDTLGLTLLGENPASIQFACGDTSQISIFKRPGTETVHTLAHFEVTDLAAVIADLEAKGVEFVDITEGPLVTTNHVAQVGPALGAWFHDPDGNTLGLRQS